MNLEDEYLRKILQLFDEPENIDLQHEVQKLRGLSPEHNMLFNDVLRLWTSSAEVKDSQLINVAEATQRLSDKLKRSPRHNASPQSTKSFSLWAMQAAAVILCVVLGYWIYSSRQNSLLTKTTGEHVKDTLTLPDNSRIFMDENTVIRYSEKFDGQQRNVYLERGNAFFSIAHDKEHPFIVQLDKSTVTVLGTSFNIRAHTNEVVVSVKTGTVLFEPVSLNEKPILRAGSGIVYNSLTRSLISIDSKNRNADAWLTRELNFTDASLQEVLASLESYYDVKIVVLDSIDNFKKFNAKFEDNTLQEVLEVLSAAYPVEIENKNSVVIIKSNL